MRLRRILLLPIFLMFGVLPLWAVDSTIVSPTNQNSHNDLDLFGQNIVNVGEIDAGSVSLSSIFQVGQPCIIGKLGRDDTGSLLTCKAGVWALATGSGTVENHGGYVTSCSPYTACKTPNPKTGSCSCPAGSTAQKGVTTSVTCCTNGFGSQCWTYGNCCSSVAWNCY